MEEVDQNKQRAAAELTAGMLGGMKHWPMSAQDRIWNWLTPLLKKVLDSNVKTDTLLVWTSFLEVFAFSCATILLVLIGWVLVYVPQSGSSSSAATRGLCYRYIQEL